MNRREPVVTLRPHFERERQFRSYGIEPAHVLCDAIAIGAHRPKAHALGLAPGAPPAGCQSTEAESKPIRPRGMTRA